MQRLAQGEEEKREGQEWPYQYVVKKERFEHAIWKGRTVEGAAC